MGKKSFRIKEPETSTNILVSKEAQPNDVFFCFKYLSRESYTRCKDYSFFINLLQRFSKYSQLGWNEIRSSGDNKVLVGLQEQQVFNVFFIEAAFGDISNH